MRLMIKEKKNGNDNVCTQIEVFNPYLCEGIMLYNIIENNIILC